MTPIYELSQGGSGPYGASSYRDMATGCVEKKRLQSSHTLTMAQQYPASAKGPNGMLVGTLVHALIEIELKNGAQPTEVHFIAPWEEGYEVPQEALDEAWRVYNGWVKVRTDWHPERTLGVELMIDEEINGCRVQAKLDWLLEGEGGVVLEDFKTSASQRDDYTRGYHRLAQHQYIMAAWAAGHNVTTARVRQIVKTKTIKEAFYEIDLPTPAREAWMQRYWKGALLRQTSETRGGPRGAECDSCYFGKNLICGL